MADSANLDSPSAIATETIPALQCPGCNATLLKVNVTPGAKVRCLHCGARFLPGPSAGAAKTAEAQPPPVCREPKSPGYWFLRIPAIVFLIAGVFATALSIRSLIAAFNEYGALTSLAFWVGYSYVPLLPMAGVVAAVWSRALAVIDRGMLRECWRRGKITAALPAPAGSSLPYIAPLAVVGGLIPLFLLTSNGTLPQAIVGAAVTALPIFLAGFMAEDLRQFSHRQEQIAKVLTPANGAAPPVRRGLGLACGVGFGAVAALNWYQACIHWTSIWGRAQAHESALIALGFSALAVTGYCLSDGWERAVNTWTAAAAALAPAGGELKTKNFDTFFKRAIFVFPRLWYVYGLIWLAASCWIESYGWAQRNDEWIVAWAMVAVSGVALALTFSLLIKRVASWRNAVLKVLDSGAQARPAAPASRIGWLRGMTVLAIPIVATQLVLLGYELGTAALWGGGIYWSLMLAIPLILGLCHYPTFWVLAIADEFARVEQRFTPSKTDTDTLN